MAMTAFQPTTIIKSFAAGLLALLACETGLAQGVVVVDDYETSSPMVEGGPSLPSLRSRTGAPTTNGMNNAMTSRAGGSQMRNQAMREGLPPQMLSQNAEFGDEGETKPGILSRLPRWKMPSIFGSDSEEQPAMQEQFPRGQQQFSAAQPSEEQSTYRGPRRLNRQSGPQAIGTFPQRESRPKQTPRLPSFSLKKLFGGGEETEETDPTMNGPEPSAGLTRRPFQQAPVISGPPRTARVPNANGYSNQQPSNYTLPTNGMNGVVPAQLQTEEPQANLQSESEVTQVGYNQRGALGSQVRPANNRPASLFGGSPNPSPRHSNGTARMQGGPSNNAFDRGPETMERLSQGDNPSKAFAPKSQPVFVSDESPALPSTKPIISSVSPETPARTSAAPKSSMTLTEPAPQVIQNDAVASQPRPQVVQNPVPQNAKREAPTARPSEKAIEILGQANAFAQSAQSEEELSQIVQMCRQVLAIDESQQAVQYSKTLAAWALNRRGELRADAGRDREAMLDFEDALHTDPTLWRAVHNRGVIHAQQGQFATAFDDFNRTVELNPKFAKAYSNRAALYTQAGDLTAALDDYRQAITLDPDLAVAHKGRGRVCHMVGSFEQALQHFDAAVLLAPRDPHIALGRADLLADMGRYAAAIEGYQQTLAIDSSNESAYRSLAWIQATCPDESFRNAEQALANAELALRCSGREDDLTLDTLAAAQANAGDFAAAQATQARAVELAPASERPLYQERLAMYQSSQPFRTEPAQPIHQATYRR